MIVKRAIFVPKQFSLGEEAYGLVLILSDESSQGSLLVLSAASLQVFKISFAGIPALPMVLQVRKARIAPLRDIPKRIFIVVRKADDRLELAILIEDIVPDRLHQ